MPSSKDKHHYEKPDMFHAPRQNIAGMPEREEVVLRV